jgi:hypothetical protein
MVAASWKMGEPSVLGLPVIYQGRARSAKEKYFWNFA